MREPVLSEKFLREKRPDREIIYLYDDSGIIGCVIDVSPLCNCLPPAMQIFFGDT